ncbi:MAG: ATP-dependent zinc metalloprotease FtsH [Bacteroidia bacterium]|nr:ATP-dependent zinc metalloprotease FtsH [Bacteroidia bacterium]
MSENSENRQGQQKGQYKGIKDKLPKKPQLPKNSINFYWIYVILVVLLLGLSFLDFKGTPKEISLQKVSELLRNQQVDKIDIINKREAEIFIKTSYLVSEKAHAEVKANRGPHYYYRIPEVGNFMASVEEFQQDIAQESRIIPADRERVEFGDHLGWILPIILIVLFWVFIMRRMSGPSGGGPGQIFNIGKSKAQLFDKDTNVQINFNDVAGLDGAKVELKEIVDFLKNPKKYTVLGAKIPKGALLVGPPGTGKTLLAKAVAGEAKVPFFSLSGSDFVEMFVGVGASRVRDLFRQAKEKAPCIIFIDEIDAIGRARGRSVSHGANDERENTLNQLLTEMDGFGTNSGVIILAATNRADILDRALLRPGRFDRQIFVDMPDLIERREIFKVHLRPLKLDTSVDIDFLARQTPGFSGADIANICNEAALIAARKEKNKVDKQDFLDAVDRIVGGLEKKNKIVTKEEKQVIAFHEAGHATVSWLVEHASPLVKVTIVPRGRSLGAAWYLPEERQITTTEQLFDEMCAALGGRAAEEIAFGKISTGALSDLEKITKQAYAMVVYYGLNEKLGNISFYDSSGQTEFGFQKPYSEKTAQTIDEEVSKLIEKAYNRTKQLLASNKDKLTQLANQLLEKEVIFKEDLETIFGKRPFYKAEILLPEIEKKNGETHSVPKKDPDSETKQEEPVKDGPNPTLF